MDEHQEPALIVPPRKRGRPRAREPKSAVMAWVPTTTHDQLAHLALRDGVSVSSLLREVIVRTMATRSDE